MPHYKNGREAKPGDKVIYTWEYEGNKTIQSGHVLEIYPNSTTCNASMVLSGSPTAAVTLSECLHMDDIAEVVAKPAE